jgi:glutathione S-transferase
MARQVMGSRLSRFLPRRSTKLYAHPFSSYCQKVLTALYENATPFELRMLAFGDAAAAAEHEALWPLKRIPVLVDEGRTVASAPDVVIPCSALREYPDPRGNSSGDPHPPIDVIERGPDTHGRPLR